MSDTEQGKTRQGLRGRISAIFSFGDNHQDSDSKSNKLERAIACSKRTLSPTTMPKPSPTTNTNRQRVSSMPNHVRKLTRSERVTLESEACMDVLAEEGIEFLDWQSPLKTKDSRLALLQPERDDAEVNEQVTEQVTEEASPGPVPEQEEEVVTYDCYYETMGGEPSGTRE